MSSDPIPFKLRMPAALHSAVTKAAAEAHRSMNSEILVRLEKSIEADKPKRGKK